MFPTYVYGFTLLYSQSYSYILYAEKLFSIGYGINVP